MTNQQLNGGTNKIIMGLIGLAVVLVLVVGWFTVLPMFSSEQAPALQPVVVQPAAPARAPIPTPAREGHVPIQEPSIEPAPAASIAPDPVLPPLPKLNESDVAVMALFAEDKLDPLQQLSSLLIPDRVLLKFVRAVIALDEGNVVKDYRPVQSPPPPMKVLAIDEPLNIEIGQRYRIDPVNYARYTHYVTAFGALDKEQLAKMYHHYYPLLDEAYQQYGVDRGGFFNVTLRAIDAVSAISIADYNPVLIQPKVFYDFQDPQLQVKSAPYKLLLRMGPENTQKLQAELLVLRAQLAKPQ